MSKLTDLFNKAGELMGWSDDKGGFHPKGETPNVFDAFDIKGKSAGWVEGGTHHAPSTGGSSGLEALGGGIGVLLVVAIMVLGFAFLLLAISAVVGIFLAPILFFFGRWLRHYASYAVHARRIILISFVMFFISIAYWTFEVGYFLHTSSEMAHICKTIKITSVNRIVKGYSSTDYFLNLRSDRSIKWKYGVLSKIDGIKTDLYYPDASGEGIQEIIGHASDPKSKIESIEVLGLYYRYGLILDKLADKFQDTSWPQLQEEPRVRLDGSKIFDPRDSTGKFKVFCEGSRWP